MRLLSLAVLGTPLVAAIWPLPSQYTSGNTTLWISPDVQVNYNCPGKVRKLSDSFQLNNGDAGTKNYQFLQGSYSYYNSTSTSQQIIQTAVDRTLRTICEQSFIPWKFHPRMSNFEPSTSSQTFITSITLNQTQPDSANATKPLDGSLDESYSLTVTASGQVTISANTAVGISYGLTSFSQLFYAHSQGGSYTTLAPVSVTDKPKFPHRGVNMDTSRNFFGIDDVKRMLDAMAFTKMNRLHWHITDAQSWPLEIPSLPELSDAGAYAPGLVYSPEDLQDIQAYGNLLGIETYIEIDMPGHTSSIWFSHPELIAAFNTQPYDINCNEPPCGTFKLNSSAVYNFVDALFEDLLPRLQPYTSYFSSGGDEVNVNAYKLDETVGTNSTAVLQPLMQKFIDHVHGQIRSYGLTPIVWEEMLLTWNLTLGSDVVIQTWLSDESVQQTTALGHKALASNYNYWVS